MVASMIGELLRVPFNYFVYERKEYSVHGLATRRFNPYTLHYLDTSTPIVKYPRHVNPTLIFIIFSPC